MGSQDIAITALRVLNALTQGITPNSDDLKILRVHAAPDDVNLPLDALACRIIARECSRVIQESKLDL